MVCQQSQVQSPSHAILGTTIFVFHPNRDDPLRLRRSAANKTHKQLRHIQPSRTHVCVLAAERKNSVAASLSQTLTKARPAVIADMACPAEVRDLPTRTTAKSRILLHFSNANPHTTWLLRIGIHQTVPSTVLPRRLLKTKGFRKAPSDGPLTNGF